MIIVLHMMHVILFVSLSLSIIHELNDSPSDEHPLIERMNKMDQFINWNANQTYTSSEKTLHVIHMTHMFPCM